MACCSDIGFQGQTVTTVSKVITVNRGQLYFMIFWHSQYHVSTKAEMGGAGWRDPTFTYFVFPKTVELLYIVPPLALNHKGSCSLADKRELYRALVTSMS